MKTKPAKSTIPNQPSNRFVPAVPYLVLVAAVILFFWEILTRQNFLWEDILYQYYPFHFFLFKNLRQFNLPLWNPYMFAGMPFLADIQTQVFYPLNWLFAFIANTNQNYVFWLVELKCIIHLFLGALSFYLLMRELKLSRYSGVLAGITFGFSGFMVSHIIHLTIISTFAWFPLILLFFYRTLFQRRLLDASATALSLGLANLAGHPQMTLHIVYALCLLFILYLLFNWRSELPYLFKNHIPLFLLTIFLGFAISAAAYLPAYRYSIHTVREMMTYAEATETSLPPWFFITILIPKFFGSIAGGVEETAPFWVDPARYTYWETCLYVGVMPLILAGIGIFFNRNKLRWQFLILAFVALLFALGKFTPLYRLAFNIFPGFDRFRIPARFVDLFTVAIAFLTGLGMEVLVKPNPKPDFKSNTLGYRLLIPGLTVLVYGVAILFLLITGLLVKIFPPLQDPGLFRNSLTQTGVMFGFASIGLLLIFLIKNSAKYRTILLSLLVGLTFFDLYTFGRRFSLGTVSPEEFYPPRPFIKTLIEEHKNEPFRINARAGPYMLLQRNEGLLWELELLEGYTPLKLTDYVTFDIPVNRRNDLLNVRYQIHIDSVRGTMSLVPNPTALPRYWLADSFIVITDRTTILNRLADTTFDFRRVAILEEKPDFNFEQSSQPSLNFATDSTQKKSITAIKRTSERIELMVETDKPAILLFSEIYYPEWKATIDGKPAKLVRADYCLRALPLTPGKHKVVTWYDRTGVNLGIFISKLAFLGIVLIFFVTRPRPKPLSTKVKYRHNT
ncbi:YfhO family protein [candidate division WOR-3 bacterium]|nr:YfhO family protein [candidate division WOR-3 bacterium]